MAQNDTSPLRGHAKGNKLAPVAAHGKNKLAPVAAHGKNKLAPVSALGKNKFSNQNSLSIPNA